MPGSVQGVADGVVEETAGTAGRQAAGDPAGDRHDEAPLNHVHGLVSSRVFLSLHKTSTLSSLLDDLILGENI